MGNGYHPLPHQVVRTGVHGEGCLPVCWAQRPGASASSRLEPSLCLRGGRWLGPWSLSQPGPQAQAGESTEAAMTDPPPLCFPARRRNSTTSCLPVPS